jgi:hypothetical protein
VLGSTTLKEDETMVHPEDKAEQARLDADARPNDAWRRYENDFNAMSDEEIAEEVRRSEDQLIEAEDWLDAVASWESAGRPRAVS